MSDDDGEVPRRAVRKGFWAGIPQRQLITLFSLLICLFAVLALRKGCADGVANMFRTFEESPDAGAARKRE